MFGEKVDGSSWVGKDEDVLSLANVHDNCEEVNEPQKIDGDTQLIKDCLAELLGGGDVACLITDAVCYFTQAVADTLKLPRIVLLPTSVCFFNAMVAVPLLYEKGCLPMQDFQLETPVLEIPPLRYKDLPIIETHDPENSIRFTKYVDCLAELLGGGGDDDDDDDVACLITDAVWYFTQAVADSLKLPRIVLRTSNVCSFNAFAAIHLLYEKGCLPMQDFQFETPVLEIPPLRYKDIPIVDTHDPENLNRFLKDMVKQTKLMDVYHVM
ncbi:hypothetical protein Q3G72_018157 [Acer saccharum]|nr:hypothetical protein Q3G72_018157 [Acer saccharum]